MICLALELERAAWSKCSVDCSSTVHGNLCTSV